MIDIEFNFNRTKEIIKADMYEPLQYVIDRYIQKSLLDFNISLKMEIKLLILKIQ